MRWFIRSISVQEDPHKIIPGEIANNLHLAQFQLLKAVQSDFSQKENFQIFEYETLNEAIDELWTKYRTMFSTTRIRGPTLD